MLVVGLELSVNPLLNCLVDTTLQTSTCCRRGGANNCPFSGNDFGVKLKTEGTDLLMLADPNQIKIELVSFSCLPMWVFLTVGLLIFHFKIILKMWFLFMIIATKMGHMVPKREKMRCILYDCNGVAKGFFLWEGEFPLPRLPVVGPDYRFL